MAVTELLCLAYSRKYSARCVAGIRLDTLEWVRPVSPTDHGALSAAACRLDAGRAPQPLDLVRISLKRPSPERHQPENWFVGEREWELVDELTVDDAVDYLDEIVVNGPELFGTRGDSIDWDDIQANGVPSSLAAVRVRPRFYVNPWDKLRASFRLGGAHYDLAVTDLAPWAAEVKERDGVAPRTDWYLTISLGERYDRNNRAYKLVAAGFPSG